MTQAQKAVLSADNITAMAETQLKKESEKAYQNDRNQVLSLLHTYSHKQIWILQHNKPIHIFILHHIRHIHILTTSTFHTQRT